MKRLTALQNNHSLLYQYDPRGKLVVALLLTILITIQTHFISLIAYLIFSFILTQLAQLPMTSLRQRLKIINLFNLLLWLTLPFSNVEPKITWMSLQISQIGLTQVILITLKTNAIILVLLSLLSTIPPLQLAYSLKTFYFPQKLIWLLLLSIRYLEVLSQEYQRLHQAMQIRGFQPGFNLHTYRSYAYLVGLLIIRSLDRAERILMRMKCRGFTGELFLLQPLQWQPRDSQFLFINGLLSIGLWGLIWL